MALESALLNKIIQSGEISARDIMVLREAFFNDGFISAHEAEYLFKLEDSIKNPDPAWSGFFVEALGIYLVEQVMPHGYVSSENARWLMKRIQNDGVVKSNTELAMLVHLMDKAKLVPDELVRFTLDQVALSVLEGRGPLADQKSSQVGVIDAHEVDLVRRVVYALGGNGNVGISKSEAEFLFRLNEAVVGQPNDPAWTELFAKAITNHLMAMQGYTPISKTEAENQEKWLESGAPDRWEFMSKMLTQLPVVKDMFSQENHWDKIANRQTQEVAAATPITETEAQWLHAQIYADGVFDPNEKAIIQFIVAQSEDLPPVLRPLVAQAG